MFFLLFFLFLRWEAVISCVSETSEPRSQTADFSPSFQLFVYILFRVFLSDRKTCCELQTAFLEW